MKVIRTLAVVLVLAIGVGSSAAPAGAASPRGFVSGGVFGFNTVLCGVAIGSNSDLLVSEYFERRVTALQASSGPVNSGLASVGAANGPCGLAIDDAGDVYVNLFHGGVLRYPLYGTGSEVIDPATATGVAVDPESGDLYIDHRNSIDVYEAPVTAGEPPALRIGLGTLGNSYGVAVSRYPGTEGRVFAADAADGTVKGYDPAVDASNPALVIDGAGTAAGRFVSLVDSSVAVDGSNGNLLVVDNLQPGFERPAAAVEEFNPDGIHRGRLSGSITFSEPVGLAVDETPTSNNDRVYVTSGNGQTSALESVKNPGQKGMLLTYGPAMAGHLLEVATSGGGSGAVTSNPAGIACGSACDAEFVGGEKVTLTATPDPDSIFVGWSGDCTGSGTCSLTTTADRSVEAEFAPALSLRSATEVGDPAASGSGSAAEPRPGSAPVASQSEVVQQAGVRVKFDGDLSPKSLPRSRRVPVKVAVSTHITPTKDGNPPQLRQMRIAINHYGHLDATGLPKCRLDQIQPATTADALAACRRSLVGEGSFSAKVLLKGQALFPAAGKVHVFSGVYKGRPAIFAHIYGTQPAPTSYTLPFVVKRAHGTYGTIFETLPQQTSDAGYITGLSLNLGRSYSYRGGRRSYLSASCPAPKGSSSAPFPFAKASFSFSGGRNVGSTLVRVCRVR